MINIIYNGIIKVIDALSNAAQSILNFKAFINTLRVVFSFFPPVFSVTAICGITFLIGMAVKRIFF